MSNQHRKITIVDCQELAKSKEGICLSDVYVNANKPLMWKCKFEHVFSLAWKHIQYYKSWCSRCNPNIGEEICRVYLETMFSKPFVRLRPDWLKYSKYNLELDGYCYELNVAFEHNGTQHNEIHSYFHNDQSGLDKQRDRDTFKINKCKELGIKIIVIPEIFKEIKLCELKDFLVNECKKLQIDLPTDTSDLVIDLSKIHNTINKLERYKKIAEEKDGKCLSETYIAFHEPLVWQCSKGHMWETTGWSIENGTWCKECAGIKKMTIDDAIFTASQKGGFCLSTTYISANKKMQWKCSEGHEWETTLASIRNLGTWCPVCRVRRQKITKRAS